MVDKRVRLIALLGATLTGAVLGLCCGVAMSMWGGIELFLPIMTLLFGLVAYVACRLVISAIEAFRG